MQIGIIDGCRTPFTKAGGAMASATALDLATHVVRESAFRAGLEPGEVDSVVMGAATPDPGTPYLAREAVIALGWNDTFAYSVECACATSARAVTTASYELLSGERGFAVAGGAESMSNQPIPASPVAAEAVRRRAKGQSALEAMLGVALADLVPEEPGVVEPYTGLSLGQHAEEIVRDWGISREESDALAVTSHHNAAAATADGRLPEEIEPIVVPAGTRVDRDSLIRPDTSLDRVAALPPVFDEEGTVTAANASPLTDGAAAVVLARDDVAERRSLEPKAWLKASAFTAHAPKAGVLLGPAYALPLALERAGIGLSDLGLIDIHEAFAGQVAANLKAMADDEFARSVLGRERAIGAIDRSLLNVCGGTIAIGHPFGATGARIILQLVNEMRRRRVRYGALAICAGGTRGAAMVLEAAG